MYPTACTMKAKLKEDQTNPQRPIGYISNYMDKLALKSFIKGGKIDLERLFNPEYRLCWWSLDSQT